MSKAEDPMEATLYDHFCPRCNKKLLFHQLHCDCGMNIDWTAGLTIKPDWKRYPPPDLRPGETV